METLHAIEAGEGTQAELGQVISDAIVKAHLATRWRLGIVYDVLPRESGSCISSSGPRH
jgi:hypothetical protein